MTGDEAVLRAVALVVHNLRLDVEGLEDGEESLDHAVTPDGASDVDGGLLGLEDLQQVGQEPGEGRVELPGEDDVTGHHDVHWRYPG